MICQYVLKIFTHLCNDQLMYGPSDGSNFDQQSEYLIIWLYSCSIVRSAMIMSTR